jgi:hypothetical protein
LSQETGGQFPGLVTAAAIDLFRHSFVTTKENSSRLEQGILQHLEGVNKYKTPKEQQPLKM